MDESLLKASQEHNNKRKRCRCVALFVIFSILILAAVGVLVTLYVLRLGQKSDLVAARVVDAENHTKFRVALPAPLLLQPHDTLSDNDDAVLHMAAVSTQLDFGLEAECEYKDGSIDRACRVLSPGYAYKSSYPGPTIEVRAGRSLQVDWSVDIAGYEHVLQEYLDESICMAPVEGCKTLKGNYNRFVTHLHGGKTDDKSDGYPEAWTTSAGDETGPSWTQNVYTYSNDVDATMLWYHDHATSITRLNNYAGLSGLYVIKDDMEDQFVADKAIPNAAVTVLLSLGDRNFHQDGRLAFEVNTIGNNTKSVLPEFYGPFIIVNGKVWPYLKVMPTTYRLRFLNSADSRFFNLTIAPEGDSEAALTMMQIGTDGGFLRNPFNRTSLLLGNAERADVVVDFSKYPVNTKLTMTNDAAIPFPGGDPVNPLSDGLVMQFHVVEHDSEVPMPAPVMVPEVLNPGVPRPTEVALNRTLRQLALYEAEDQFGRVLPQLGTLANGQGQSWHEPVTETPTAGDDEEWELWNLTEDAHPIHIHLISHLVLSRWVIDAEVDPPVKLEQLELWPVDAGLKDTLVIMPGTMVSLWINFPMAGEYVWHCHILSHEDHDMMRPMRVLPANTTF